MKIAVVSQRYHWESYSVVRSLVENIGTEKDIVRWYDTEFIYDSFEPAIVFYIGANARGFDHIKPKIGIGLSDPNLMDLNRINIFDLYFTSDYKTSKKYNFPWLPCFSDFKYYHKLPYDKRFKITFIGGGPHPIVTNRIEMVNKLRDMEFTIYCFGDGWPLHKCNHKFIKGPEFLKVINQTIIMLDLTNENASMSSRIFQAAACGVPVVTFYREDIFKLFGDSLLYYKSFNELCIALNTAYNDYGLMKDRILLCYLNQHDISHRILQMWKVIHDKNIL